MARTIAVLGASNTGKSTLVDRMCALEGQPHPAAGAGRAPGRELHPSRRDLAGDRHPGLDRAPARRHRRAARRRRRGGLRRPRPGGGASSPRPTCTPPRPPARPPSSSSTASTRRPAGSATSSPRCRTTPSTRSSCARSRSARAATITGAVDLVSERAWAYREGEPSQLIEIPAGTLDREHEARGELLEHLSEFDDHLLEELIEDRDAAERRGLRALRPRPRREPRRSRR